MKKYVLFAAVTLFSVPAAHAQSLAFGPNISTLGVGAEVPIRLNRTFVVRLGGNYFDTSMSRTLDDVDYNLDVRLASAGASLDFHPFRNGLLISGGYFWNGNRLKLSATPTTDTQIGNQTFTPAELGSLTGELGFAEFAPFLGLGYDSTFYTEGPLSLTFRAGVLFLGNADVNLSASGALAGDPSLMSELRAEEKNLEDSLNDLGIYPVVTLGIKYRF